MLIDINAFFGHWPYWPIPNAGAADLLAMIDRFGIDKAAVTSLRGLFGDWPTANAETLAATREHPDRFVPIACLSPMNNGGGQALRNLVSQGFMAVRLYPLALQGYSLNSGYVADIAHTAGECGIPIIIPTRPMRNFRFPTLSIDEVVALALRHPETTFILSGPNYLSEFRAAVEGMTRCPNILIEISCMQGLRAVARLVESVGAQRILFGTGAVLQYPACNVAKLQHAGITTEQRNAIACGNTTMLLTHR